MSTCDYRGDIDSDGSLNARSSPADVAPLVAITRYCWPFSIYVIGDPVWGADMKTDPTSAPVALSYARSIAPRTPAGVVKNPGSPAITSVFVTSVPMRPFERPVRGIVKPFSAGWLRTASGVSPWATCQTISPLPRSIAEMRPHGGLTRGSPWTVNPRPKPPSPNSVSPLPAPARPPPARPPPPPPPRPPAPARPPAAPPAPGVVAVPRMY